MLLRSEGIDLAAPVCKFAAGHLLIDFEWDVVDHPARLAGDAVTVIHKIFRTQSLDREGHVHDLGGMAVAASFFGADGIEHAAMLDESGCCMVPAEALTGRRFDVGLTGVSAGEKRATNTVAVYQREAMR